MIIAQLSDLHLTHHIGKDDCYQRFMACLELALTYQPDFLLLTGDLINDGNKDGYDWLFDTLNQTGVDFCCLAGNHDGTLELNHHLPFNEREFLPVEFDHRLSDCQQIWLGNHQLLTLNSAVPAHIKGHLHRHQLKWLDDTLSTHPNPAIIALHHHPIRVRSQWIDAHKLDNGDTLLSLLQHHRHAHTIVCGHVHQAHTFSHHYSSDHHIQLLTCPATSRQFLPFADDFGLDSKASGFRLITLSSDPNAPPNALPNALIDSHIVRLS